MTRIKTEYFRSHKQHLDFRVQIDTLWYYDHKAVRRRCRDFLERFYPDVVFRGINWKNKSAQKELMQLSASKERVTVATLIRKAELHLELYHFHKAKELIQRLYNQPGSPHPQVALLQEKLIKATTFPVYNLRERTEMKAIEPLFVILYDQLVRGHKLPPEWDRAFLDEFVLTTGLNYGSQLYRASHAYPNPIMIALDYPTRKKRHDFFPKSIWDWFKDLEGPGSGNENDIYFWKLRRIPVFAEGVLLLYRRFNAKPPRVRPDTAAQLAGLRAQSIFSDLESALLELERLGEGPS